MREQAFAQDYDPSVVDRFGVWLSARQIRRWVPSFVGKRVADLDALGEYIITRSRAGMWTT